MYICSWRSTVSWEVILVLYFLWPCIKQCKFCLFYNDEGFTSNGSRPKWCIPTLLQCPLEGIWMHPQFLNILLCCHYSNNSFSQCWFFFNQCEWNSALFPLDIIQLLDIKKQPCPYLLVKWSLYKKAAECYKWKYRVFLWVAKMGLCTGKKFNRFLCPQHVFHLHFYSGPSASKLGPITLLRSSLNSLLFPILVTWVLELLCKLWIPFTFAIINEIIFCTKHSLKIWCVRI